MKVTTLQAKVLDKAVSSMIRGHGWCVASPAIATRLADKGLVLIVDKYLRIRECGGDKKHTAYAIHPTEKGCELAIALRMGRQALSI